MPKIVLIAHNIRSTHNVGSLLRSADGLGVEMVYLTGYTPYPEVPDDQRLPHIRGKTTDQIHKTALGAENSVRWEHHADVIPLLDKLRCEGYCLIALEQTTSSTSLIDSSVKNKVAMIVGSEIGGIDQEILTKTDLQLEIPMLGTKESFNVAVAAAIALYHIKFMGSKVDKAA